MAWQYPRHICGHDGDRYQAYGKCDLRKQHLAMIESHPCPDCRKKERGEISHLLSIAKDLIGTADEECAIWRLANALGLLSKYYPNAVGVSTPTGLGYRIQKPSLD